MLRHRALIKVGVGSWKGDWTMSRGVRGQAVQHLRLIGAQIRGALQRRVPEHR